MRCLITGATGLIGSHLIDLLQGEEIYAFVRGQRPPELPGTTILHGDLLSQSSIIRAIERAEPEVIFHLGAVTAIGLTWDSPELVMETNALGTLRLLEAVRVVHQGIRIVNASTADQFGNLSSPGHENSVPSPRSPYAVSKQAAYDFCRTYRDAYDMCISNVTMYNCTSERQGPEFIVPKVCNAASTLSKVTLGNLSAERDWTDARDHARGWRLVGERTEPLDVVLASGVAHSIRDLCQLAYGDAWESYVTYDANIVRPTDTNRRVGFPAKAKAVLGWEATTTFPELVRRMVK